MRLGVCTALLGALLACGNYGPPVRTQPAAMSPVESPQAVAPEECDEDEEKKRTPER